ncbi:MAG TPA: PQQ-binding-like beta-propeller repeat protein [Bdellovibrionales bacterium]|nr:PQQ-binding-like beta-propeller repeat protein [Bdellovibrionales bacterium]
MTKSYLTTLALAALLSGCASLSPNNLDSRSLVLERNWALSTISSDHLGYRHAHQMTPVIAERLVLQGNSTDGIVAINRNEATTAWNLKIRGGVASGAQVVDDKVYFGASDGHFYAVEAFTGRMAWAFPTRVENLAGPLVHNKTVYFLSGNDVVYALNSDNGQQRWMYTRTSQSDLSIRGGTRPAVFDKVLYIGFSDGFLAAIHADDGSLLWERQLGTSPKFKDIDASPWVDAKNIYVSSYDNYLYNLSRTDGQVIWRIEDGGAFPVTVAGNVVYYATSNGKVKAVDRATGQIIWERKLKSGIATQPVLFEGNLVYGESDGALRVVEAKTGQDVAQFQTGHGVNAAPAIDPKTGHVYVMSNEGNLFSLAFKWQLESQTRPVRVRF